MTESDPGPGEGCMCLSVSSIDIDTELTGDEVFDFELGWFGALQGVPAGHVLDFVGEASGRSELPPDQGTLGPS